MERNRTEALATYRQKRDPAATPEPFDEGASRPRLFVVQHHAARRLHHDLRLEMEGVLRSWALPRGPSKDPKEKRLAVLTEDHPVEYADFEGIIPKGNYGAGAMIVWDRGLWIPLLDPAQGLEEGKFLFELRGYKLRGVWTLVRGKRETKEWLLMKKPDAWAVSTAAEDVFPAESVFSGLTVQELAQGSQKADALREELSGLGLPKTQLAIESLDPMTAETAERPFSGPGWLFELKYDGYRVLAGRHAGRATLRYRSGMDATRLFPEITRAVAALPFDSLILDGEVVVLDDDARPAFQRLQSRNMLTRRADIERSAIEHPATFYAFDLPSLLGFDLRGLPLALRKALLKRVVPVAGPLRFADHVDERGEELFAQVSGLGLEGLMAKKVDSHYRRGRSADWLKIRTDRTGDFAIVGFRLSEEKGRADTLGALHVAARAGPARKGVPLVYAGRVGSGFTQRQLEELRQLLEPTRRPEPACAKTVDITRDDVWVTPHLVCEVRYKEWTDEDRLRHPVFLRLREDKAVYECDAVREGRPLGHDNGNGTAKTTNEKNENATGKHAPVPMPVSTPTQAAPSRKTKTPRVLITRREKLFWPEDGFTKGDLIDYAKAIAPWLLPYLKDRPIVLDRYPDGIHGKSFFQKNAPEFAPEWIRTVPIWSEDSGRAIEYVLCDDEETLLFLVNLGTIPFHIWASHVPTLDRPDWCVLDLDPKEAPFAQVVDVARALHKLLTELGLPSFAKTSGGTGMHVLVPLGAQYTHEQSKLLAELIASVLVQRIPKLATINRNINARGGRVYVDFLQNGNGKLLVAPYSPRPVPGARVSMPLSWDEVTQELDPRAFTIKTAPGRVATWKEDPLRGILKKRPNLERALARLSG